MTVNDCNGERQCGALFVRLFASKKSSDLSLYSGSASFVTVGQSMIIAVTRVVVGGAGFSREMRRNGSPGVTKYEQ